MNKLALGTAQFGMPYGVANAQGQVEQREITAILSLASSERIYTLDTANVYGKSEEAIGTYLSTYPDASWQIVTKIKDNKIEITEQIQCSIKKLTVCPNTVLAHSAELFLDHTFHEALKKLSQTFYLLNLLKFRLLD